MKIPVMFYGPYCRALWDMAIREFEFEDISKDLDRRSSGIFKEVLYCIQYDMVVHTAVSNGSYVTGGCR